MNDRTQRVQKVLWVTLLLNWAVAAFKIIFGMMTQTMVIVADGVHSFSDGASNIIGLIAIRIAGHPADENHPYGHQKYETLASTLIAFFLFMASFEIVRRAFDGFLHPQTPQISFTSFAIMGGTLVVNIFVAVYERKKGKELKSDFLTSDSWHTLTDVFVTLSVFAALIGIKNGVPYLDAIFSLGIAAVIVFTAFKIIKDSSDVLCDRAVMDKETIAAVVRAVPGVLGCHEIRTRGRSDNIYVDLHVLVDSHMTVFESHHVASLIEKEIVTRIPGVSDVVVHIEPASHDPGALGDRHR